MSFWHDLYKLWQHAFKEFPPKNKGGIIVGPFLADIRSDKIEERYEPLTCEDEIFFVTRPDGSTSIDHVPIVHNGNCSWCRNKMKKNPDEPLNSGMIVEVNCPACGMISYIGSVRDGETKELRCEAGEASCGYSWSEKFKVENIHDYDIENLRKGKWHKTNWGCKDNLEAIKTAVDCVDVFSDKKNRERDGHLAKITDGVRVVDRHDNILYQWNRNPEGM